MCIYYSDRARTCNCIKCKSIVQLKPCPLSIAVKDFKLSVWGNLCAWKTLKCAFYLSISCRTHFINMRHVSAGLEMLFCVYFRAPHYAWDSAKIWMRDPNAAVKHIHLAITLKNNRSRNAGELKCTFCVNSSCVLLQWATMVFSLRIGIEC